MVHTPSPPVAPLGDADRDVSVLFAGMFSGIPRWRLRLPSGMRASTTAQSAPRVVGSLPPVEEFPLPVFYQVHQEQSTAGEMTENIVESPVVQEQVVVQAIPRVVGSFPPCEVFAAPVFDQVHQEPRAAGEITENIVEFPVVPEQVIVQAIPHVVGSLPPVEEFTRPVYNLCSSGTVFCW